MTTRLTIVFPTPETAATACQALGDLRNLDRQLRDAQRLGELERYTALMDRWREAADTFADHVIAAEPSWGEAPADTSADELAALAALSEPVDKE